MPDIRFNLGPDDIREAFAVNGSVDSRGRFEIMAITSGNGNGWEFSESVLQDSMELWDGVECFVDHGGFFGERSVKDLGGVCRSPRWDPDELGVRLDLQTLGPSADLVTELGREMLEEEDPKPKVGFSADIIFTAKGKEVTNILRVLDLSLVFNPARGGAFKRAMNQIQRNMEVATMPEEVITTQQANSTTTEETPPENGGGLADQLREDAAAIEELQASQAERQRLAEEAEQARQVRIQMCAYMLDTGLAASRLPEAMQEHVRSQFTDRVFTPEELNGAIDEARQLVSDLQGSGSVVGPTRVRSMFTTVDQLQAAVDDLLGAPREEGSEDL